LAKESAGKLIYRFIAENPAPLDRYGNALTTAAELSARVKAAEGDETPHFRGHMTAIDASQARGERPRFLGTTEVARYQQNCLTAVGLGGKVGITGTAGIIHTCGMSVSVAAIVRF
jgi:hypothetical protein